MEIQTKKMLKKILYIDFIIAAIISVISMVAIKEYAMIMAAGLFMAAINFILNAIFTYNTFLKTGNKIHSILAAALRVIITGLIAVLLYNNNKNNLFAFIIGYILHYVAIVIYGVTLKKEKGSD